MSTLARNSNARATGTARSAKNTTRLKSNSDTRCPLRRNLPLRSSRAKLSGASAGDGMIVLGLGGGRAGFAVRYGLNKGLKLLVVKLVQLWFESKDNPRCFLGEP